jgi:hypothetical protein
LLFTVFSTVCEFFTAKPRNSAATRRESELLETPGVSDAAQAGENTRKNSFLN